MSFFPRERNGTQLTVLQPQMRFLLFFFKANAPKLGLVHKGKADSELTDPSLAIPALSNGLSIAPLTI